MIGYTLQRGSPAKDRAAPMFARYGGKRALALDIITSARALAGGYGAFASIEWARVERLVFLCRGNICRSAYAAARARTQGLAAVSAGLQTRGDRLADAAAIAHGRARGVALETHRTTAWADIVLGPADLVLAMEPPQARKARARARTAEAQITLAGLWSIRPRPWIFDPYGLSEAYWTRCLDTLDEAVARVSARVGR